MKAIIIYIGFLCLFLMWTTSPLTAQDNKEVPLSIQRKNVIKYNPTPYILLGATSMVFGYERIVKQNQSFSINMGYLGFPGSSKTISDSINVSRYKSKYGWSFVGDYRFYLKKENKFLAPHGLYIGPYYAWYNLNLNNTIQQVDENGTISNKANMKTRVDIHSLGFEMGYQFVLFKRMTLDLILIGPSISNYRLRMKFDESIDLSPDEENEYYEAMKAILLKRFPLLEGLFKDEEIDIKGNLDRWLLGYRYVIQIGYNF